MILMQRVVVVLSASSVCWPEARRICLEFRTPGCGGLELWGCELRCRRDSDWEDLARQLRGHGGAKFTIFFKYYLVPLHN